MSKEVKIELSSNIWIENITSSNISFVIKIENGGNNKIYKLITDSNDTFLYKKYFTDDRNRMEREYGALQFLNKQGLTCLPNPIAKNIDENCALYTFIEGEDKNANLLNSKDVSQIVEFINVLQSFELSKINYKFEQSIMSTNSFSLFANNIIFRINKFLEYAKSAETSNIVTKFYKKTSPHKIIMNELTRIQSQNSKLFSRCILPTDMKLSPVDFGPHNMIFNEQYVNFIDFEYFGWDDPVKIIPNLIFHEGSNGMAENTKKEILDKYVSSSKLKNTVIDRLSVSLSLASLDWLSILLWGLTPEKISARLFSNPKLDVSKYQEEQISKIINRLETFDNPQLL